ncbi:YadA C-terminal domain-containing protein, partial [Veillonella sp.]
ANTTQITQNTNNITSISNEVSNITNNVTSLNSQVNKLDNRINRVGAGAAALAALHPQDYDPTAKWDFAAGYGNYKSANAVAIGAFYRPTNDLLFSIGTSMGGGENMFNAGVSVKFGSSNEYSNYSKSALAEVVSEQSKQLANQNSTIEELRAQVQQQAQENAELRTQVQEIMRQLANK